MTDRPDSPRPGESGRVIRIMLSEELRRRKAKGERFVHVTDLPWELFASDTTQGVCGRNHGQSLSDIARRGGFDASEALCVLTCQHWRDGMIPEQQAHRILYMMRHLYRRGVLMGREVSVEAEVGRIEGGRH